MGITWIESAKSELSGGLLGRTHTSRIQQLMCYDVMWALLGRWFASYISMWLQWLQTLTRWSCRNVAECQPSVSAPSHGRILAVSGGRSEAQVLPASSPRRRSRLRCPGCPRCPRCERLQKKLMQLRGKMRATLGDSGMDRNRLFEHFFSIMIDMMKSLVVYNLRYTSIEFTRFFSILWARHIQFHQQCIDDWNSH